MPGSPETPSFDKTVSDHPSSRRLVSRETPYQGRIWNIVSDTFELNDHGPALTRDFIDHPGAVAIVPINDAGKILLIRQYRHPVGMDLWEIPAGLLDIEGEDFVAAAARELAEETDLVAGKWSVLADFFNSPGSSSEAIRIYLAQGLSEVPEADRHQREDEEAEIEFHWMDLDDAVTAVLQGRFHNPSAVVGILALAAARSTGFDRLRPADAPWPAHPSQR